MGVNILTIFDLADESKDGVTLSELMHRLNALKNAKRDLERAREKFEGNPDSLRENYLDFYNLTIAIDCVEFAIEQLESAKFDTDKMKWSTLIRFGKYKTRRECQMDIDLYLVEGR